MTDKDSAIKDAHEAIVAAIQELRDLGVTVPHALHRAAHSLHHATADGQEELPRTRPPG